MSWNQDREPPTYHHSDVYRTLRAANDHSTLPMAPVPHTHTNAHLAPGINGRTPFLMQDMSPNPLPCTVRLRFSLVVLLVFLFWVLLIEGALKVLTRVTPRCKDPLTPVTDDGRVFGDEMTSCVRT